MIGSEGATNDDIVFELVSESQFDGQALTLISIQIIDRSMLQGIFEGRSCDDIRFLRPNLHKINMCATRNKNEVAGKLMGKVGTSSSCFAPGFKSPCFDDQRLGIFLARVSSSQFELSEDLHGKTSVAQLTLHTDYEESVQEMDRVDKKFELSWDHDQNFTFTIEASDGSTEHVEIEVSPHRLVCSTCIIVNYM